MSSLPKIILFNGLGGAGQRHLRLFREQLPDVDFVGSRRKSTTPTLNADFSVKEGGTLEDEYRIKLFPTIDEAYENKPDLAVIAMPTAFHAEHVIKAAERGVDVFVEKPGATTLQEAKNIVSAVKSNGVRFFISYQRRFHPLISKFQEVIKSGNIGKIMSVKIAIASYVPDWHAYEDFRQLYACRLDLGGGVLTTEIHEIDLLTWLFGLPKKVFAIGGCRGLFELDVEDSAELLLDYGMFTAQLSMSFMQKKQERTFEVVGQDGWVKLDLNTQKLTVAGYESDTLDVIENVVDNDTMFRNQVKFFLEEFTKEDGSYLDALVRNATILEQSKSSMEDYI